MSTRRSIADFPRNEAGLVDEFIGTAFDAVYQIYKNLEEVLKSKDYAAQALASQQAAALSEQAALASEQAAKASEIAAAESAANTAARVQEAIDARDFAEAQAILALGYVELVQAGVIEVNAGLVEARALTEQTRLYAEQVGPIRADLAEQVDPALGAALNWQ